MNAWKTYYRFRHPHEKLRDAASAFLGIALLLGAMLLLAGMGEG